MCLFTVFVGTEEADPLVVVEMVVEVARHLCWEAGTRWSCAILRTGRGRSRADRQDETEAAATREEVGIRMTFYQVSENRRKGRAWRVFPKKEGISGGMDEMMSLQKSLSEMFVLY